MHRILRGGRQFRAQAVTHPASLEDARTISCTLGNKSPGQPKACMQSQVIIDNPYVTMWYHPAKKIVHHKIHKFIFGAFRICC
jgi:hypothetical protein